MADSAESLALSIEAGGNEVRTASSGSEALTAADEFRPDLAILDIGMPDLDGYEVARRLRARRANDTAREAPPPPAPSVEPPRA